MLDKVTFNRDDKFDFQLSQALIAERRLADIFTSGRLEKIELKTENFQWEQTGNIAIEYARCGKPSGLAVTQADYWVHELRREDATLVYLMFPIARLKHIAGLAWQAGRYRVRGGDGRRTSNVILPLRWVLR
jgi:hypothetical protein